MGQARHGARGLAFAITFIVALGVMMASLAVAAPGTQTWTGDQPATEDILEGGVTLNPAVGAPIPNALVGTINFTLNGEAYVGYCTDVVRIFNIDDPDNPVDITTLTPPLGDANERALVWVMLNHTPTGPVTPEKERQAAITQLAVWILDDDNINKTTPTGDAALNDAAHALVAQALAATAAPASLTLTAATPAAGATSVPVTVTGRAGAVVDLSVTSGPGTLSASQVTLGADGAAMMTLSGAVGTTTAITATTAGDGTLIRINPVNEKDQRTATARPSELQANAQVTFTPAPPTPPTPPAPPAPPVTPPTVTPPPVTTQGTPTQVTRKAVLRINKTGPARARGLQRVTYRIVVRNTGNAVARNVVIRDHLPKGLAHVRSPKGTFRNGVVTFRLGNLRPGARKVVRVIVKAPSNARGRKLNVATVRATGLRPVRDTVRTVFRPLVIRVSPAVTG